MLLSENGPKHMVRASNTSNKRSTMGKYVALDQTTRSNYTKTKSQNEQKELKRAINLLFPSMSNCSATIINSTLMGKSQTDVIMYKFKHVVLVNCFL